MLDLKLFLWTSLVIIMAPGPNAVIIIQASISRGMGHALSILCGSIAATITYCTIAGFGLSAIITTSPFVFNAIKFLGCFYIMYLGVMGVYKGVSSIKAPPNVENEQANIAIDKAEKYQLFMKGFITGILNVALILLVISLFPQFIVNKDNMLNEWLVLSVSFVLLQLIWYVFLISALVRLRKYMLKPLIQGGIKIITSSLLIFLSIKIFIS